MADVNNPPLNVQPQGLLDQYDLKNGGRYPQFLGTVLQPVIDLNEHYRQTNGLIDKPAAIASAAGSQIYNVMTPRDYWQFVNWIGITWAGTNAGDSAYGDPVMYDPTTGRVVVLPADRCGYVNNAAGTSRRPYALVGEGTVPNLCTARNFWVPPAWGVAMRQYGATVVGAPTYSVISSRIELRA